MLMPLIALPPGYLPSQLLSASPSTQVWSVDADGTSKIVRLVSFLACRADAQPDGDEDEIAWIVDKACEKLGLTTFARLERALISDAGLVLVEPRFGEVLEPSPPWSASALLPLVRELELLREHRKWMGGLRPSRLRRDGARLVVVGASWGGMLTCSHDMRALAPEYIEPDAYVAPEILAHGTTASGPWMDVFALGKSLISIWGASLPPGVAVWAENASDANPPRRPRVSALLRALESDAAQR